MQAQIVLTPSESKKLIAHAVLCMPKVKKALEHGIVVMHPSSSTLFIFELLFGKLPENVWVCGCVTQRGLYGTLEAAEVIRAFAAEEADSLMGFRLSFYIKRGVLQDRMPLGGILDSMIAGDIYIKGVNAIDTQGNAGVLFANPRGGGGTIGSVLAAQKKRGFDVILPAGLEKLVPGSISDICKTTDRKATMVMGMPCGLYPVRGEKVDETDAFRILCGAKATPIAAGGIGGAEGAVVLAIDGDDNQVARAYEYAMMVKGARLPTFNLDIAAEKE